MSVAVSKQQGISMQDRYVNSDRYNLAVSDLETIARKFDPAAPDDLRTRIIEVLGDLGLWPDSCFTGSYEPRPQQGPVDYAAIGKLAISRFPKVHAILAN